MGTKNTDLVANFDATQVFASMSIGATRMQEELVGYIECDPT